MGWVWDLLRVQAAFDLEVDSPVDDVVQKLRSQIRAARPSALSGGEGYAGELTDRGFALRRFGHAMSRGESRPAVDIRGEFRPEQDRTRVAIVIRHRRLLVSFAWLLVVIGLVALGGSSGSGDGRPGEASSIIGAAVLMALGVLWHLRLWWDVRRVRREVVALLTAGARDGPADSRARTGPV